MRLNSKGFTLIEVLISLQILLIVLMFLPLLVQALQPETNYAHYDTDQFIRFLEREIQTGQIISVKNQQLLILNHQKQIVTIEKYQNVIRRQVNQTGHEVLLHHVDQFDLTFVNAQLNLTVIKKNGDRIATSIVPFYKQ